jgi:hypothetical protein
MDVVGVGRVREVLARIRSGRVRRRRGLEDRVNTTE